MLPMLRKSGWPDSLARLALFADCSPAELRRIGSLVTMLSLDAGTVLMTEGALGLEFLVIADGTAEVSVGHGHVVAELGPGDFAGEMSLLARGPRTATVTAVTPLTVYVCNSAEFSTLLEVAPSVAAKVTRAAEARSEELRQAA
jgi:CRP-like cAMP-binding protein